MGRPSFRLARAAFALACLLYVFVTPPFGAHDEANHFNKAVSYSQLIPSDIRQGDELGNMLPGWVSELERDVFPVETPGAVPTYRPADILAAWSHTFATEPRFTPFSMIANYPPTVYLPQTLGIVVARSIGLPPLGMFYAARLFNALALIAAVLTAIRLLPLARPATLAFLAFPVIAVQAGSCSSDVTVIGLAYLAVAVTVRIALRAGARRLNPILPILLPFLALAKGVYLPVSLAGLAFRPRRSAWLWLGASLAISVLIFLTWSAANGDNLVRQPFFDRTTHQHVVAALPREQAAFVLAHPFFATKSILLSFAERIPAYGVELIGRFGWFAVMLPLPLYGLAVIVMMLGAVHPDEHGHPVAIGQRLVWLGLAATVIFLIELALYMTATPLGAGYVQGTQGRYFIPLLPLVALAISMPARPGSRLGRLAAASFQPAFVLLVTGALLVDATAFWRI